MAFFFFYFIFFFNDTATTEIYTLSLHDALPILEADLTQAVLSEANLSDADLEGAELMDSYLHGANLKGVVHLTCDQIELANFDKDTVFPDYITIHWTEDGYCECQEQ